MCVSVFIDSRMTLWLICAIPQTWKTISTDINSTFIKKEVLGYVVLSLLGKTMDYQ